MPDPRTLDAYDVGHHFAFELQADITWNPYPPDRPEYHEFISGYNRGAADLELYRHYEPQLPIGAA